jgi:hypothetical protein
MHAGITGSSWMCSFSGHDQGPGHAIALASDEGIEVARVIHSSRIRSLRKIPDAD